MKIVIIYVILVMGLYNVFLGIRNREHVIEKELIYEGEFKGEKFIQILISTEDEWKRYAELYGYDDKVRNIEFDKESVFICSFHKAKQFSYSKKNSRKGNKEVLDIVFDKEYENRMYVYVVKKNNIISWEATGNNPDAMIKFE